MIDAAQQRTNMVESQVLTSDVTDRRILRAMGEVARERFVPPGLADLAYMDDAVPLTPAASGAGRAKATSPGSRSMTRALPRPRSSRSGRAASPPSASARRSSPSSRRTDYRSPASRGSTPPAAP